MMNDYEAGSNRELIFNNNSTVCVLSLRNKIVPDNKKLTVQSPSAERHRQRLRLYFQ